MSLLGKILAVLNLLGAFVLVFLGAMDYGKRQAFGYAALEREAILKGLPLDDQEKDLHGNVRAKQLSEATRKELFGSDASTLKKAVEEVKQTVDNFVGGGQDQAARLARVLLPLARSNAERERLLGVLAAPADANVADLQAQYQQAFQPAVEGRYTADGASRTLSADEQRAAVAHVMFSLAGVTDASGAAVVADGYRRAQGVVGLEAAVREVSRQAQDVARVAREAADEADRERSAFLAAHRQLIDQLQQRAREVEDARGVLERVRADAAAQEALVKGRERDLTQARQQLADLRQQTADRLKELRAMSDALYEIRLEVRRTSDENRRREQDIRKLEQGR
jgi:hypothetical protein